MENYSVKITTDTGKVVYHLCYTLSDALGLKRTAMALGYQVTLKQSTK